MSIANHPDPAPPRGALSLALPAALALAAAMGIGRFAFTPVWPLMAQEAGLSLAQGSWLASANYAGYLLGALAAAVRPPRHPRA
ncbi:YbfB/YjiJ family MFS transporter, partial [Campylobacter lari]